MKNDNVNISLRQAMLLFIVLFFAPAIRYIPIFAVNEANQAAWLAPFISVIFEIVYMAMLIKIFKKYKKESFIEIIIDVFGKILGKIICVLYLIWLTLMIAYNLRMFAERILTTINPSMSIVLLTLTLVVLVVYVIKDGIVVLSRMNELFFAIIFGIFVIIVIFIIPEIHINNLIPITYKDAFPVFKANMGILAIWAYNIAIFMFADKILDKKDFKNVSVKLIIYITIISFMVIIIPIGIFGNLVVQKMPVPFFSAIMQVSLFDSIERIESIVVVLWIITDFILISALTYATLHIITKVFKLEEKNTFLNIYMILIFFLSLCIAKTSFELSSLSINVLTPLNIIMGYCIPVLTFLLAKIRKKI